MNKINTLSVFIVAFQLLCGGFQLQAEELLPINLAVSNATTGPAAKLGTRLNQGANAYFSRVNKQGGVAGRKINLVVLDDGYEPYKTLKNTQKFLERNDIFAFFNYVGTPTTYVILPIIKKTELPFLTPFTGAEFLRSPVIENVYNLRASYYQEASAQIDYLVNVKKFTKIGLLIQADAFGAAVEQGYLNVMKRHGIEPEVVTRYRRNTSDINLALNILKNKQVQAVAFVGTYQPLAKLVNLAYQQKFEPFFTTVSFISSHELFQRIEQPSHILVTEVVPDPYECQWEICQSFIQDMKAEGYLALDRVQFEGYLNAVVTTQVLKLCENNLTPACFFNNINQIKLHLGEDDIEFAHDDHQGLDRVYLNVFNYESYSH
ncbi:ABC transporter substrate-binding protein [Thalassotalea sp. G2M2-11]|uniref:ABC transporter substrate-binding protein n=1 Tax=Thalassotalea sp. G2M2-11 TaxID=2787627 RepID=UPI0019CF508B|nr:ABC transporter substrate-binding protein [Thalassotalea sp. G2M2-11]